MVAQGLEIGKDLLAGDPRRGRDGRNREIDRGFAGGPHASFSPPLVSHDEMTRVEPFLEESAARVVCVSRPRDVLSVEVAADESGTRPP